MRVESPLRLGFFRVSKEDPEIQEIEPQIKAVCSKFGLKRGDFFKIFTERGSAYDIHKISKRKAFFELLSVLFDSKITTLENLFLPKVQRRLEVHLYVWDYHRIMRNFRFSLLFGLLCDLFNVKIFSYKQDHIESKANEKPIDTFTRYIFYSINAFSSEDYSWNTSQNIKKSVIKDRGVTRSDKTISKKWGRRFTSKTGENIELEPSTAQKLYFFVCRRIREEESRNQRFYGNQIIAQAEKRFGVLLSKAYISKLKKEVIS